MKRVSIIGAGNGGVTAAYHLSRTGCKVCLYDAAPFDAQIDAIREAGGIEALSELEGHELILPGFERVAKVTTEIEEALSFADLLLVICPSFAQEPLFQRMLPFLVEEKTVVLMPGNYGGLVLRTRFARDCPKVTFVDATTIPWACRLCGPGKTAIMGMKSVLPCSVLPTSKKDKVLQQLADTLPLRVEGLANPVVAGLENVNFGGHPLLTTLSMGILENFGGAFSYYRDCCSPATARAADRMDRERLAVGRAYGFSLRSELDAVNHLYGTSFDSVFDFNRASETHSKITSAPSSSQHRYITEDVPYLLVPCMELGRVAGLELPIIESCIRIASAYNDEDYFQTGRTLEKMGLAGLTIHEMVSRLQE